MNAGQELALWIQALGIIGYVMSVSLAVLWAGIAIAYIRAGMSKRVWVLFTLGMIGYSIVFVNLVFIATDPTWVDRIALSLFQRSAAIVAASLTWAYSILALRQQWRRESNGAPLGPSSTDKPFLSAEDRT